MNKERKEVIICYKDGKLYKKVNYRGDLRDGMYEEYNYQGVKVKEYTYLMNNKHNMCYDYYDDGNIKQKANYNNGVNIGFEYYDNRENIRFGKKRDAQYDLFIEYYGKTKKIKNICKKWINLVMMQHLIHKNGYYYLRYNNIVSSGFFCKTVHNKTLFYKNKKILFI